MNGRLRWCCRPCNKKLWYSDIPQISISVPRSASEQAATIQPNHRLKRQRVQSAENLNDQVHDQDSVQESVKGQEQSKEMPKQCPQQCDEVHIGDEEHTSLSHGAEKPDAEVPDYQPQQHQQSLTNVQTFLRLLSEGSGKCMEDFEKLSQYDRIRSNEIALQQGETQRIRKSLEDKLQEVQYDKNAAIQERDGIITQRDNEILELNAEIIQLDILEKDLRSENEKLQATNKELQGKLSKIKSIENGKWRMMQDVFGHEDDMDGIPKIIK